MVEKMKDDTLIRCEQGEKVYYIPQDVFARVVLATKSRDKRFVRYKTGAEMYDMSERRFKEIAKDAGARVKINMMALVNVEQFEKYLDMFRDND